jgi:hypothetical protein
MLFDSDVHAAYVEFRAKETDKVCALTHFSRAIKCTSFHMQASTRSLDNQEQPIQPAIGQEHY